MKRQELVALLGAVRDGITVDKVADDLDQAIQLEHRDFSSKILSQEREQLRKVDEALARIGRGEYGICQNCDETISIKRLKALPWAELCKECQERAEQYLRAIPKS